MRVFSSAIRDMYDPLALEQCVPIQGFIPSLGSAFTESLLLGSFENALHSSDFSAASDSTR
jgi:hypothetical protein